MKRLFLVSTALLFGLTAFAEDKAPQENAGNEISYEEALQKCAEFVNDPQLVTIEFKVGCFDESTQWKETGESKVQHDQKGTRGYNLIMKEKWFTPDFAIPVVKDPSESSCPVLTEFVTARQTSIVLSCDEFVNSYQDPEALANRCDEALAEASPQTQPTGKEVNLCGGKITE